MAADDPRNFGESAGGFVEDLVLVGPRVSCDDGNESFGRNKLPEFYNEAKCKRARQFYQEWLMGMFFSKLMGLMAILAIPSISKILKFTNMSNEPMTAYKRYLSTIFHMNIWYSEDFNPDSKIWKSLQEVKGKHNHASKRSCSVGFDRISQYDMALTQFGFMGFVVARSETLGIVGAKSEDLEAFVHLWRVIGHLMGIEDRFNICRESLEETRAICEILIERELKPGIYKQESTFMELSHALISGMWCMQPTLNPQVYMLLLLKLVNKSDVDINADALHLKLHGELSRWQICLYWFIRKVFATYHYLVFKVYHNYTIIVSLWLMVHFPFLALYKFGRKDGYVTPPVTMKTRQSG